MNSFKKMPAKKRVLTAEQEFEIMKLVLDKFLWLGTATIALGVLVLTLGWETVPNSLLIVVAGAIILILFIVLIVREYEWMAKQHKFF